METRKEQVKIVDRASGGGSGGSQPAVVSINRDQTEPFIEKQIVAYIIAAHHRHIEGE